MKYEIDWEKVKSLPEKERSQFIDTYSKGINNVLKEKRNENIIHFFGLFILLLIPIVPVSAGILWLLNLVISSISFNWIFVGIISGVISAIFSAKSIW